MFRKKKILRDHIKELGEFIKNNPDKCEQYEYTFIANGLKIWTEGGLHGIDSFPSTKMFVGIEKQYIFNCINICKVKKVTCT